MSEDNHENMDDKKISDFMEMTKKVDLPPQLRALNKERMMQALDVKTSQSGQWFRRRFSVSFPVAAGFLLAFCIQMGLSMFLVAEKKPPQKPPEVIVARHESTDSDKEIQTVYSRRDVYVNGMGFIKTTQTYFFPSEVNHESK